MPFSKSTFPDVFDPSVHEENTYQAFNDYIEAWEMSYEVACIGELKEDASELTQQQHKAKVFRMCVFQGERLKTDLKSEFNQDLAQLKRADFNTMVQRLGNRYRPTQNQVLLHYQFHGLRQEPGEKIDTFINKVRQHADRCAFKCTNPYCTEKEKNHKTLIRDQIIIGTSIRSIREEALEREHELDALITQARKIEATEEAVRKLDTEKESLTAGLNEIEIHDSESDSESQGVLINKIGKKGGKYSLRSKQQKNFQQPETISKRRCLGCGNPKCDRGPTCRARGKFCNICGRRNHFSSVCLTHHKEVSILTVIGATTIKDTHTTEKSNFTNITLEGCQIRAMIDTGAEANVILESQVPDNIRRITKTHVQLQPYGSRLITPKGEFTTQTHWKEKKNQINVDCCR